MHSLTMKIFDALQEWYWEYGKHREGKYLLSPSGWLDRLYIACEISEKVTSSNQSEKRSMALWGTSQTGKSTLLSSYLDKVNDPSGENSALTWTGGTNIRFCRESLTMDPPAGTTILNPYNLESDASSCISRFRLSERVDDPAHPIELKFASEIQIMHALAMGYLTEAKLEIPQTGEEVRFNSEVLQQTLDSFRLTIDRPKNGIVPSRNVYKFLHQVADLMETLILSDYPRYSALSKDNVKSLARQSILDFSSILHSIEDVENLAFHLFWDGDKLLAETYRKLVSWTQKFKNAWQGKRILASPPIVALLLDVASYSRLHNAQADTRERAKDIISQIRFSVEDEFTTINTVSGHKLLDNPEEFSLFQGNILELIIPVKLDAIRDRTSLVEFLSVSDLLDCPGTGRDHDNREMRLDLNKLKPAENHLIFTRLLKRGKTASIVAAYSKDLTIDGFSMFCRVMYKPGQPGQLTSGIKTWWKAFGQTPSTEDKNQRSPLPLNLVMSFWGRFFNSTSLEVIRNSGVESIFKDIHNIGLWTNPDVVTSTLAVNYPKLENSDAKLPAHGLDLVVNEILKRTEFQQQFKSEVSVDSFKQMIKDGGTDFLFKVLNEQAVASPRNRMLNARKNAALEIIHNLIFEGLPSEDDQGEQYRQAVEHWSDLLTASLSEGHNDSKCEKVSFVLRRMLSFPPEKLEPIPIRLQNNKETASVYIQSQCNRWVEHARNIVRNQLTLVGLKDPDHANFALNGIIESVNKTELTDWFLKTLGNVKNKVEGDSHRRYLGMKISDCIFPTISERAHRIREEIVNEMDSYEERDRQGFYGSGSSPHYRQFLKPFIDHLHTLSEQLHPDARPPQPGDLELLEIQRKFELSRQGDNYHV